MEGGFNNLRQLINGINEIEVKKAKVTNPPVKVIDSLERQYDIKQNSKKSTATTTITGILDIQSVETIVTQLLTIINRIQDHVIVTYQNNIYNNKIPHYQYPMI